VLTAQVEVLLRVCSWGVSAGLSGQARLAQVSQEVWRGGCAGRRWWSAVTDRPESYTPSIAGCGLGGEPPRRWMKVRPAGRRDRCGSSITSRP